MKDKSIEILHQRTSQCRPRTMMRGCLTKSWLLLESFITKTHVRNYDSRLVSVTGESDMFTYRTVICQRYTQHTHRNI
jgi:hypothetical protein